MDVQVWPLFWPCSLWGFAGLLLSDKFVEFFARNAGAQPCLSKRPQTEPCQIWVWSWNNLDLSIDKVRFSGEIIGLTWFDYDLTMAMFGHLFFGRYSNRKETLAKGTSKDQDFDDMRVWPLFSGQVPTVFVSLFLGVSQLRPYDPLRMGRRSPQVNKCVFYQVNQQYSTITIKGAQTVQHSALLNQRYRVDRWYIHYMVLLQEFLHPPRTSRDDCGERITQKSIPSRVAKFL